MGPVEREYKPGDFLFQEGEESGSLFLIKKGAVSIRKRKGDAYVEVSKVYENEVIGEMSFFDREKRSAAAVAINDVVLIEITFDSLEQIYQSVPDYLKSIMAAMAERLRKADDMIQRLQKNVVNDDDPKPSE